MATYQITQELESQGGKFRCMVQFNGNEAEYYEVESLEPQTIAETLQTVANAAAALQSQQQTPVQDIEVENGQVVVE